MKILCHVKFSHLVGRGGSATCHMECVYNFRTIYIHNGTYERQYACILVCIHRCTYVSECVMQCGQSPFPLTDCVCTLSDKQRGALNSWHSPGWMDPICVFLNLLMTSPWQSDPGWTTRRTPTETTIQIWAAVPSSTSRTGGRSGCWEFGAFWGQICMFFPFLVKVQGTRASLFVSSCILLWMLVY